MNPIGVALVLWLVAGLDWGLRSSLELGTTGIVPSLLVVVLTFVCMRGPGKGACVCAVVVGLMVDLLRDVALEGREETTVVVGPAVVGALFAAVFVVNLRGMLYQRNLAALAVLSGVSAVMMHLVAAMLLVVRSKVDDVIAPGSQFGVAIGGAVYTAVAAIVLGPMLFAMAGLMGLGGGRRPRFRIS